MTRLASVYLICLIGLLAGCGPKMASVSGKVTFEGKPVTAGALDFVPKAEDSTYDAGRPASAALNENGEFTLTTNSKGDGALVGVHKVSYRPPSPPRSGSPEWVAKQKDAYEKFGNLRLAPEFIVEVKSGSNNLEIKLERAQ